MKNGGAAAYEENSLAGFQSNQGLGVAYYKPNGEGTTNHVFHWYLSPEEIEYITHDLKDDQYPVTVTRWFRYVAKDEKRMREVNNYSAPYPYLWVKMTLRLFRPTLAYKYTEKIDNYWFNYQRGMENGWSGIIFDIQAPRDGQTIRNQRWLSYISSTMTADGTENHYKLTAYETSPNISACGHSKYYFAPKEYKITAKTMINRYANNAGLTTYTITPRNGNSMTDGKRYREPSLPARTGFTIPAPIAGGVNDTYVNADEWDQMFCKYVYPHTYDNMYLTKSEWWTKEAIAGGPVDYRHLGNAGVRATNNNADIRYINDPTYHRYVQFLPNGGSLQVTVHDDACVNNGQFALVNLGMGAYYRLRRCCGYHAVVRFHTASRF